VSDEYQPGFYQLDARVRDAAGRRRQADKIVRALARHGVPADGVCLDVGCSAGEITRTVAPLFRIVMGLDYDATALGAIDRALRHETLYIHGDAMHLPLREGAVSAVICAQVYEHVPDADRLMAEIHRVLAPGGVVFFSGPNALYPIEPHYHLPCLHWLPRRWAGRLLRLIGRGERYYERPRTPWGLQRMVRRFRLQDITLDVLRERVASIGGARGVAARLTPTWVWRALWPLLPNYNWILTKPPEGE